jgi:hypothetical protein
MIKIMRLSTGEDVIGEINEEGSIVTAKDAFAIIPMQSSPGKPVQLMLTPWMPYSDDKTITVDKDKVITIYKPKVDILKSYQQNTSQIITPGQRGLITETSLPQV